MAAGLPEASPRRHHDPRPDSTQADVSVHVTLPTSDAVFLWLPPALNIRRDIRGEKVVQGEDASQHERSDDLLLVQLI